MAKRAERKQETGRRMLDAASRSFRSKGLNGVGVDGIANQAGATSGAFYAHMGSKDAAFTAALELGLDEVIEAIPNFQIEHGETWVEAFTDYYLGKPHREDMECGCAMTALTPDVMRASKEVQALYAKKMCTIAELIAKGLSGKTNSKKLETAWSFLHVLIGGLSTTRALGASKQADNVAAAAQKAALQLVIANS